MAEFRSKEDKEEYRRLLDEIGEDYCPHGTYCVFKEFLISTHPSRRLLVQLKCMDRYKLIKSKDAGEDIGWEVTMIMWIDDGCAKLFADYYADNKSDKTIFNQIIKANEE